MIDYSSIKFGYTDGKDFTLTGFDYIGYYHIDNGTVYASRQLEDKTRILNNKHTFAADLIESTFFRDRLIVDDITLPYSFNKDILIAANETCNGRVLNDRLYKLYTNTLYVYSKCFIADNDIPQGFDRSAGCLSAAPAWIPQQLTDQVTFKPLSSVGLSVIGEAIQFKAVKISDNLGYAFLGITPTTFVALSSDARLNTFDITSTNTFVDENSDLQFLQLSSFSIAGDFMYISDAKQNNVYKYDVSGFFKNDTPVTNRRYLVAAIGGEGNALAKTKFNSPGHVYANDAINRVYVYDKGNKCIKIYDINLSYVATRAATAGVLSDVRAMEYNATYNKMYVIIEKLASRQNILQICNADLIVEQEYIINDVLLSGEFFKGIQFSCNDSNIMYMSTNTNIFKKFVNTPSNTIGKWLFYKSGFVNQHIWNNEFSRWNRAKWRWNDGGIGVRRGVIVNSFCLLPTDMDADEIFIFAGYKTETFNRVNHYLENTQYTTVLGTIDRQNYSVNDLKFSDKEMIQAFVLNKELHKILTNILYIKNYLMGRYAASYDYIGNLVNNGITGFTQQEFDNFAITNVNNLYVHDNEIASSAGTLNRIFEQIWNIQNSILNLTSTRVLNFVPSVSGSQTILLN